MGGLALVFLGALIITQVTAGGALDRLGVTDKIASNL